MTWLVLKGLKTSTTFNNSYIVSLTNWTFNYLMNIPHYTWKINMKYLNYFELFNDGLEFNDFKLQEN